MMVQEGLLEEMEAVATDLQQEAIHTRPVGMVQGIRMPAAEEQDMMEVQVSGESHHLGKPGTGCPTGRVRDENCCSEIKYLISSTIPYLKYAP